MNKLTVPEAVDADLYNASFELTKNLELLPETLEKAKEFANSSDFIKSNLPEELIKAYTD